MEHTNITEETKRDADSIRASYKQITDMLENLNQLTSTSNKLLSNLFKNLGFKEEFLDAIVPVTQEEIETLPIEDLREFALSYMVEGEDKDNFENDEEVAVRKILSTIKKEVMNYWEAIVERDELTKMAEDTLDEYVTYVNEHKKKNNTNVLEELKEKISKEEDSKELVRLNKLYEEIEKGLTYKFIYERLETIGKKEVDSIKKAFFSNNINASVVGRYKSKITKVGYGDSIIKYFINIEENFLPEDYHVFNNLFLFIYMRYVAFSDPYKEKDKKYIISITSAISDLVYHKFDSDEEEKAFVDIIKKTLDYFKDYSDEFKRENTFYKNSSARINKESAKERGMHDALVKKIKLLGGKPDESLNSEELLKVYQDILYSLVKEQRVKEEEQEDKENIVEDQVESEDNNSEE